MRFIVTILLLTNVAEAQGIDTLSHAKAYRSNFLTTGVYGLTSNGHKYTIGFNINGTDPLEAVRIDLTSKSVSYKTITGTVSDPSALWQNCFDSSGNLYFGFNYTLRRVVKFSLKDSISYRNLGNGFSDGQALVYNFSLGLDKHIYGSSSSGDSTYWFDYNPSLDTLISHRGVDAQHYGLTIQGDSNWVYIQTGQDPSIDYLAVRKSDDHKKKLFSIYSSSRFNIRTGQGFAYVWPSVDTLNHTYRLKDTTTTQVATYNAVTPIEYEEVNKNGAVTTFSDFDDSKGRLYYTINSGATIDSVNITSPTATPDGIDLCFSRDTGNTYYIGNLYGSWYRYNQAQDSAYRLGKTAYNIYTVLKWDDTTFYFGGYPNGTLLKYTTTKAWTVGIISGTSVTGASSTSNPKLVTQFRTSTAANFHHPYGLVRLGNLIIAAGGVIRVANTASIAVYDVSKDSVYGYDADKMINQEFNGFNNLAVWNNRVYMPTNNGNGGTAKIYIYNPYTNVMEDSISVGLIMYGKIFIVGRILYGISETKLYKINLHTKQLIYIQNVANGMYGTVVLPDARVFTYTSQPTLPSDWWNITKSTYQGITACHNDLIYWSGSAIYKQRSAYTKDFDLSTFIGRVFYTKNKVGL